MGRCAHRPSCLWFANQRVRLTKPPQIAGLPGWCLAAPAAGARVVATPRLRRSVQVSCGWPRAATAPDLRALAGARAASERNGALGGALRARSAYGAGRRRRPLPAHFLRSVARLPANAPSRAHFLRFVVEAGAPRAPPPPASPSKTAGQTNDKEITYRNEGSGDASDTLERVRASAQTRNKPKKTCTKRLSADAPSAGRPRPAGARRLWAPAGRARARRHLPRPSPARGARATAPASCFTFWLHVFCGSLQARRRGPGSCTFFEVRCIAGPLGGARRAPVGEGALQKRRSGQR